MSTYDLKRLEVAIKYIRRMSEGKNPVTGRPSPENEVLSNVNVHRCMKFIDEVLTDVQKSGGTVGLLPPKERSSRPAVSETFPYDSLQQYQYLQDQQISYFLKQLEEYLPEGQKMPVAATTITLWMRENGYLEKQVINDTGKENSVPTKKGESLGMYSEKGGLYPNEYYRVFYNEQAQRFIIENFRKILKESEELRERNRREKKSEGSPRSARQGGGSSRQNSDSSRQSGGGSGQSGYNTRLGGGRTESQSSQYSGDSRFSGSSRQYAGSSRSGNIEPSAQFDETPVQPYAEPAPIEDLPQEYYEMLSKGWDTAGDDAPWS